jgi:hypothetical protein
MLHIKLDCVIILSRDALALLNITDHEFGVRIEERLYRGSFGSIEIDENSSIHNPSCVRKKLIEKDFL